MSKRGNNEGTLRKRTDGRWEGRYTNSQGKFKYIYGRTKQEVLDELKELIGIKEETRKGNTGGDLTLESYFEHYISVKECILKQRTISQIKLAFKNHILPLLGKKILYNFDVDDIVMFKKHLDSKNLSLRTKSNISTHFKTLMNFATKEGVLRQNPFIYFDFSIKKNQMKRRRSLEDKEINLILNEVNEHKRKNDHFYLMICTLIYTGMRVGELCALRWNDINEDFTFINIDESHTDARYETTTKTECSVRTIPINKFLSIEYQKLYKEINPKDKDCYIFINKCQKPFTSSVVSKRLHFIEEEIKKKYDVDLTYITPHYFRHTFTTKGLMNGVQIKDMQELLGHADTRTLLDIYSHTTARSKITSVNIIYDSINLKTAY